MSGITAFEVGRERETSIALHVDDADCDTVFSLTFQYNGLRRADIDMFPVVGRSNTLVNRLVQYIDKLLVPDLVAVETQQTFLVLAFVDGNHDVCQQIIFPVPEDWSPFYIAFAVTTKACRACPYPRLARQRVRFVLLANHNLGQFDDLVLQRHGQFVTVGVSRVGDCRRLVGNVCEGQFVPATSGYRQREVPLCVGDNAHAVPFDSDADVLNRLATLVDDLASDGGLRLYRQREENSESKEFKS